MCSKASFEPLPIHVLVKAMRETTTPPSGPSQAQWQSINDSCAMEMCSESESRRGSYWAGMGRIASSITAAVTQTIGGTGRTTTGKKHLLDALSGLGFKGWVTAANIHPVPPQQMQFYVDIELNSPSGVVGLLLPPEQAVRNARHQLVLLQDELEHPMTSDGSLAGDGTPDPTWIMMADGKLLPPSLPAVSTYLRQRYGALLEFQTNPTPAPLPLHSFDALLPRNWCPIPTALLGLTKTQRQTAICSWLEGKAAPLCREFRQCCELRGPVLGMPFPPPASWRPVHNAALMTPRVITAEDATALISNSPVIAAHDVGEFGMCEVIQKVNMTLLGVSKTNANFVLVRMRGVAQERDGMQDPPEVIVAMKQTQAELIRGFRSASQKFGSAPIKATDVLHRRGRPPKVVDAPVASAGVVTSAADEHDNKGQAAAGPAAPSNVPTHVDEQPAAL